MGTQGKTRESGRLKSTMALEIVQAATQKDVSLPQLARLAEVDPAFGLRVLAMVNSPTFALAQKVGDLQQAVSLLGIRGLRNLALSLALSDMVPTGQHGQVLLANSIRRGVAAKLLATAMGEAEVDSHFAAGLFLESGLLVRAAEDLEGSAEIARQPARFRTKIERSQGWQDHPTLGADLARKFRLPKSTVRAIRNHHAAEPGQSRIEQVTWAAERIAAIFEGGAVESNHERAVLACAKLGFTTNDTLSIVNELPDLVQQAAGGFQREVARQHDFATVVGNAAQSLVELNNQFAALVHQLEATVKERQALAEKLQRANKMLSELAFSDSLTGLANKRAFNNALKRELSRSKRNGLPVGLIMMDVDHFRKFNETYGHPIGDEVLRKVGHVLRGTVRESDFAARYGGEEFVVILPEPDTDAEHIDDARVSTETGPLGVTGSFGVASNVSAQIGDAAALISAADGALYRAKHAGRNRVEIYASEE